MRHLKQIKSSDHLIQAIKEDQMYERLAKMMINKSDIIHRLRAAERLLIISGSGNSSVQDSLKIIRDLITIIQNL